MHTLNHETDPALRALPLDALHRAHGARMTDFAGYAMPLHYPAGIVAETMHTRSGASLFDISHMGQALLRGANAAAALESCTGADLRGLALGRQRYALLTAPWGGILDDIMVSRVPGGLFLVVNASRRDADFAHIAMMLPDDVRLEILHDRALLALQGPKAQSALQLLCPPAAALPYMGSGTLSISGTPCMVARTGYTGEDGFEFSVPLAAAERIARLLLAIPGVAPAGLGARDILRLEAGLCLYGADLDEHTTPAEAGLGWTLGKQRRSDADYPGGLLIAAELAAGPRRQRVGILVEDRIPARAGAEIRSKSGELLGTVTSGGFSPVRNAPIAMGYVSTPFAAPGTAVSLMVRGRALPARIVSMPFVPSRVLRPENRK